MKQRFLLSLFTSVAVMALMAATGLASAAEVVESTYPVPYGKPSVESVTSVMQRVREHAEKLGVTKVTDSATGQEITDFSEPNQEATATMGGYPMGVLHSGMLLAGEVTGDKRFTDYTARRLQFIAERLPYFQAQSAKFGMRANAFKNFLAPSSLDSCGAWGAALVRARQAGVGPDLKVVIDRWADFVSHHQFRLDDGTLARNTPQANSIWGDDMYMSVPFLSQMGKLTGEARYYDDAARQVVQIANRLFFWPTGLFAHAWSAGNADFNPRFYWGRANGWCEMAMCDLLDVLPENHPIRPAVLKIMRTHIQALAVLQSDRGLWHQVLDKQDSYLETSCTAMFAYAMAHAINHGWISAASYGPVALSGWNGVASKVGPDGSVGGVCIGTNYGSDMAFYYHRPAVDDQHGYGPVLLAGSEIIKLLKSDRVVIRQARGQPVIFTDAK